MLALLLIGAAPPAAHAFGDVGHEVIALVARAHLTANAAAEVDRLLALDTQPLRMRGGGLTTDGFERQATWADYYRDQQREAGVAPERIHSYTWHFADIEIDASGIGPPCVPPRPLPAGVPASAGPDPDCLPNKIAQFYEELRSRATPDAEKLLALKYLLHLVGDVHQPLHAADHHDRGGNAVQAALPGGSPQPLHRHWDSTFVERIGSTGARTADASQVAAALRVPTVMEANAWLAGLPRNRFAWTLESWRLARRVVYAPLAALPRVPGTDVIALDDAYVREAERVTGEQLLKAGYRLAGLLNHALAQPAVRLPSNG